MSRSALSRVMAILVVGFAVLALPIQAFARLDTQRYEAYDLGPSYRIDNNYCFDFRVREEGSSEYPGKVAYCFNFLRKSPPTTDSPAASPYYRVKDADAATFASYADNAGWPDTLRQDVLNVVWNGYPYFKGSWKGFTGSGNVREDELRSISATQHAIWYLTDTYSPATKDGSTTIKQQYEYVASLPEGNSSLRAVQMGMKLVELARENPAPANFELDLYDSQDATSGWSSGFQNLLTVRLGHESLQTVPVTVEKSWVYRNGAAYQGPHPDVIFDLYRGTAETGLSDQPIASKRLSQSETSVRFDMLKDGEQYTIRERMTGSSQSFVADADRVIDMGTLQGDSMQVEFVNTYQPKTGSLRVGKQLLGGSGAAGSYTFNVRIFEPDGVTPYGGPYSITTASGTQDDLQYSASTGVTATIAADETFTIAGLPADAHYTVTEEDPGDGSTLQDVLGADSIDRDQRSATGVINANKSDNLTFGNLMPPNEGSLSVGKVVKTVSGVEPPATEFTLNVRLFGADGATPYEGSYRVDGGSSQTYDADTGIALTLAHGQTATISEIPEDARYTITEDPVAGYPPENAEVSGSLGETGERFVEFVNRDETHDGVLTLEKRVEGASTGAIYNFAIVITNEAGEQLMLDDVVCRPSGLVGEGTSLETREDVIVANLTAGEQLTISGLPNEFSYRVWEIEDVGDTLGGDSVLEGVDVTASHGTVEGSRASGSTEGLADPVVELVYVNRMTGLGDLSVRKDAAGTFDPEASWTFTVTLAGPLANTITGTYGEMEFTEGVASFSLAAGEVAIARDLPAGCTYRVVEEQANQGCRTTSQGEQGTIGAEGIAVAQFFNDFRPQSADDALTVNKVWAGDGPSGHAPIQVQLFCDGAPSGEAVTLDEECGWTYTWDNLEAGHAWSVDEVEVPDGYVKTVAQADGVWTITNTYAPEGERPREDGDAPGAGRLAATGDLALVGAGACACGGALVLLAAHARRRQGR